MTSVSYVPKRVSVIIVTWNVRDYAVACIKSLEEHREGLDLEVIVIDNASTDGTAEEITRLFPSVRLIRESANRGFPASSNIGIRQATGEHLLLLNPDTEVGAGCIQACLEMAESKPSVGMVGCRLIYPNGETQYECACEMPSLLDVLIETLYFHVLMPRSRVFGRLRMSYWDHADSRPIPRISGAFMLVRGDVFRRVGLLNQRFFMYYEDLDYCARVQKAGFEIYYLASVQTIHHGGKSREKSVLALDELSPQVKFAFFRDHRGSGRAFVFRILCAIQCLVRMGIAVCFTLSQRRNATLRSRPAARVGLQWRRFLWCLGLEPRKTPAISAPMENGLRGAEVVLGKGTSS